MSWAVGYDENWKRDIGYGVPSHCDHPECRAIINRGLAYVCGGSPYGGEHGCGLYFCSDHLAPSETAPQLCERCQDSQQSFQPKPDLRRWLRHKLLSPSWSDWRTENEAEVFSLRAKF